MQNATSSRPSLPPLQSLGLPDFIRMEAVHNSLPPPNVKDKVKLSTFEDFTPQRPRQLSASSSMTTTSSLSRSPTPPSDNDIDMSPVSPSPNTHPHVPGTKFTLIPSSFDDAEAFIVFPPNTSTSASAKGHLLVGPTAAKLRRTLSRDTRSRDPRIHPYVRPYRMISGHVASRRASLASTMSQDA